MSDELIVGLIVAALAYVGSWWGYRHSRVGVLEQRVDRMESKYDKLVAYAQELRAHIYRGDGPPPPAWPNLD